MKNIKWCADRENDIVVAWANYVKNFPDEERDNIEYYVGSFAAACKYFGIDGTKVPVGRAAVVRGAEIAASEGGTFEGEVIQAKMARLLEKLKSAQFAKNAVIKTTAEIFVILKGATIEQYTYVSPDIADEVVRQVIAHARKEGVPFADVAIFEKVASETYSSLIRKRYKTMRLYYIKNAHATSMVFPVPLEEVLALNV